MKSTIILFTLGTAAALASPTSRRRCRSPGTYRCAADKTTMEVCDWDGKWKRLDPGCPSGTACENNPYGNNIPYCMAVPVDGPVTNPGDECASPGKYTCFTDTSSKQGIQICDLSNKLQVVGMCPNYCSYIAGIPYCF